MNLEWKEKNGVYSAEGIGGFSSSKTLHHPPQDDDRSAVTIWLPKNPERREELAGTLERMAKCVREARPETGLD
jgi:hypothetical protein